MKNEFYLAGGTALAIHLGHRESVDLDWFCQKSFSNSKVKKNLEETGKFELISEEEGTINGLLDNIKVSFFKYDYDLVFPLVSSKNINLADERDVAAMKIDAISSRGSKKDFIDLFFLLKKHTLEDLLDIFSKKYKNIKFNKLHILKSLAFFEDAESDPMPVMLQSADWISIKNSIQEKISIISI
ncbi:MAG: hypothetical protein A2288_00800 [Candidatus Moranbacteria bacterium RIFOXYA12_FULL_44_15]|nr:MAG: hypothetical protein A2288_00800 [Candidatus Moranbacteria bacterium RIFOXYA12_FULL_44_15]OGI35072.1 MAG: hypothetical protein A2259_04815 [Candidatus Moranbacteria bacterium RIFOXYA2_FULL_43_15]